MTVVTAPSIASSDRNAIEDQLAVELLRARCDLKLAEKDRPADLEVVVDVALWRESEEPGGAPLIDPQGYETPGHVSVVEARFTLRVLRPGSDKPLEEKTYSRTRRAATQRVGAWDPRFQARRLMLESVADDASRLTCKELKRLGKDRAAAVH